ncbi:MAG: nucleotide exchange factor GrpE [Lentisphaeria bacterium]|nr:nucleotide exchange factor GrpE [Lentisphaeria bacterium]
MSRKERAERAAGKDEVFGAAVEDAAVRDPGEGRSAGTAEGDAAAPEAAAAGLGEGGAAEAAHEGVDYRVQYEQAQDRWLRTKAEFENYRRRMLRELAESRTQTTLATVREFLTVYDHFRMALDHASRSAEAQGLIEGLEMIYAEFGRVLDALGVSPIETLGKPFDPQLHEAIAQEHSDEVAEGHVSRQWKSGFVLGDHLVRPAGVVVSLGPASEPTAAPPQAQ